MSKCVRVRQTRAGRSRNAPFPGESDQLGRSDRAVTGEQPKRAARLHSVGWERRTSERQFFTGYCICGNCWHSLGSLSRACEFRSKVRLLLSCHLHRKTSLGFMHQCPMQQISIYLGRAKAITESPGVLPKKPPPPAAITTYCRPFRPR